MAKIDQDSNLSIIVKSEKNLRLDHAIFEELNKLMPEKYSRNQIISAIKQGHCMLNSKLIIKPSCIVKNNDHVFIKIELPINNIEPDSKIKFDILYEDKSIMVISKPAGLVVHPARGTKNSTLVNGIYSHLLDSLELSSVKSDLDEPERLGIVHRLDKDTSGCMVIAKTMNAKRNLQSQLVPPRTMKRIYNAIVFGGFIKKRGVEEIYSNDLKIKELRVNAPISRHPIERIKFKVNFNDEAARQAETTFRILSSNDEYQLLECELATGRTHQIRVHLEYLQIFIIGDPIYGKKLPKRHIVDQEVYTDGGQLLHARELSFLHPETQERLDFIAPFPEEFIRVRKELSL